MNTKSATPACCAGMPFQCNRCRKSAPNAQTLRNASIVAMMRETGCTAAEAEKAHGVKSGKVYGA